MLVAMRVWRRGLLGPISAAIVAAGALALSTPAQACACGAFLSPDDADVEQDVDIEVPAESAIISWDGETERIILSLDVETPADGAALLIPTPAPATVELGRAGVFEEMEEFTAPRVREVDLWWPEWLVREDLGGPSPSEAREPAPVAAPVEEVSAEVLPASDADGLEDWLSTNGYVMRDEVAAALVPYIQQDWHFILLKIEADALTGRLQPLDIRFETNQLIYPTRLSVVGGPVQIRTYVFAEHRMERSDSMGGDLLWAGPVSPTDFTHQTLVELGATNGFLTAWEQSFADPRNQIDGDMVFAAGSADTAYERVHSDVRRHELFGAPAGPTLVFGGLVLVGVAGVTVSIVRRRQHREHP